MGRNMVNIGVYPKNRKNVEHRIESKNMNWFESLIFCLFRSLVSKITKYKSEKIKTGTT